VRSLPNRSKPIVSAILRFPVLAFAFGVEQLRRLPGAQLVGPSTKWLARLSLLGAFVLFVAWAVQVSPQRISLADLAAGNLGPMQSWIIVTGDLADEPGSTGAEHVYRLTDPAAPNASLIVTSRPAQSLGRTTVSGRISGGRGGVPVGFAWSAQLTADEQLAEERPVPPAAIVLAALGLVIMAARRTRYPMFVSQSPGDASATRGGVRVIVHGESGELDRRGVAATLSFPGREFGAADLTLGGSRAIPVRLHSAFTRVDAGRVVSLTHSEPALRIRPEGDDLVLAFASFRERDSAFAALSAEARPQSRAQPTTAVG
jgi:hypothetical protein